MSELPRQSKTEALTEVSHVLAVDFAWLVPGVKQERCFDALAGNLDASDKAASVERTGGKRPALAGRSVAAFPIVENLEDVEIDSESSSVVEDEVPRPVVAPRIETIHAHSGHRSNHGLELHR